MAVFAVNADFEKAGVADRPQIHVAPKQHDRLRRLQFCSTPVFFAPGGVQIQLLDDLAENHLGLNDFEFSLQKIGIIPAVGGA